MAIFFLVEEIIYSTKENCKKKKSAYDGKNENPGDIQEIFKVKKSRRWDQKNQKSRRYPGDGNPENNDANIIVSA